MFVAGLVFFALGYLAKPMIITLPFLMLLLDYWPLNRYGGDGLWSKPGLKRAVYLVMEKAPYFASVVAMVLIIVLFQRRAEALPSLDLYPFGLRLENALLAYSEYLKQTFWPTKLAVYYPHALKSAPFGKLASSVIVLAGISIVCLRQTSKRPYLIIGWLWFVGMLIPVIGLVQLGGQARADRYTYLPLIGIFFMVVWSVYDAAKSANRSRLIPSVILAAAVATLMIPAWHQTHHWRTGVSLFEHTLAVTQNNAVAHANLGAALMERGDDDEAKPHFVAALAIEPGRVPPRINLGLLLIQERRYEEALEHFRIALAKEPRNETILNYTGVALVEQGNASKAMIFFEKALEIRPGYLGALSNLGNALLRAGRPREAIARYTKVLDLKPNHDDVLTNLGGAYVLIQSFEQARPPLEQALAQNDENEIAHLNLALALYGLGKQEDARRHIQRALRIRPDYKNAREFLSFMDEEK